MDAGSVLVGFTLEVYLRVLLLAVCLSFAAFTASAAEPAIRYEITISTAQQDAETMARAGVLKHCGRSGGRLEGIGSGRSREGAIRACCYYGTRPIHSIGVAMNAAGRWFACIRYR